MKNQLIDLTCHDVSSFEPYVNEEISFPVGVVALAKNQAVFFIPKGAKPEFGGRAKCSIVILHFCLRMRIQEHSNMIMLDG